jgi:two-component system CAI-1 autoinducer sensor kinase/phosphatase CqsS
MEIEVEQSNGIIDMLLMNAKPLKINPTDFEICSISYAIDETLKRYPFSIGEKELISWESTNDFLYKGKNLLTIHVLFNLIKNSIYYIMEAGRGHIEISILPATNNESKYNFLRFRDTGSGIDAKVLPHIFDKFFSDTYHGYGIGLAFCKMVLRGYGGDITCQSIKGEYTEFMLMFPKVQ